MFTGIIEEMGVIKAIDWLVQGARFQIEASLILQDMSIGDSICVNGCCLTVVSHQKQVWVCDVVQETLDRTHFKQSKIGNRVNLERAVRYQDRLGGHLVQGHIDGTGNSLSKVASQNGSWWITIATPPAILRYVIHKGSIAVDGVSLTVAEVKENTFSFAMIPHTAQITTLGFKQVGEPVNLEVDIMAKYIERFIYPFHSISNRNKNDEMLN